MLQISEECKYALRSLFELAKRRSDKPVSVKELASAQAIPPRFLETIINTLRHNGYVKSRRGKRGGYTLLRDPAQITMGEIIRLIEGAIRPVKCVAGGKTCPQIGKCAFEKVWAKTRVALEEIFDGTTLQNLVDDHVQNHEPGLRKS